MRWTDKPRKKTRREIVLEYIKFMKIMGYYDRLVTYMYRVARYDGSYMYIKGQYREAKVLCHKQWPNLLNGLLGITLSGIHWE